MPIKLPVPEVAYSTTEVSLGGLSYSITYSFNEVDNRWRFDLYLLQEPVILGVKVMEGQSLLARYLLDNFSHGDIYCLRFEDDGEDVGRNNLGIDLPYELVYLTNEEIEELTSD